MLGEPIASQSEVIRAIALEGSPCCGGPTFHKDRLDLSAAECRSVDLALYEHPVPRQRQHAGFGTATETPSPRTFIFSAENSVCKHSYRRQCRRNRLLRSLPTLTSVRILTDSVL